MKYRTDIAALLKRYTLNEQGCHIWTGYANQHGYGRACITMAAQDARCGKTRNPQVLTDADHVTCRSCIANMHFDDRREGVPLPSPPAPEGDR